MPTDDFDLAQHLADEHGFEPDAFAKDKLPLLHLQDHQRPFEMATLHEHGPTFPVT